MSNPTPLSPPEQEEVLREIGGALVAAVPDEWQELELIFYSTVGIDGASFVVTKPDGTKDTRTSPTPAMRKFGELRSAMYEEEKGSWFTARLIIRPPGRFEVDYDYDSEPEFVPPLTAGAYALDFDYFPRSAENTPEWLREKLAEAAQSSTD